MTLTKLLNLSVFSTTRRELFQDLFYKIHGGFLLGLSFSSPNPLFILFCALARPQQWYMPWPLDSSWVLPVEGWALEDNEVGMFILRVYSQISGLAMSVGKTCLLTVLQIYGYSLMYLISIPISTRKILLLASGYMVILHPQH